MREYVLFSQHAKQFVRHAFIEFILMLMRLHFQKGNQQSSSLRSLNSNWKVKRFIYRRSMFKLFISSPFNFRG